MNTLKSVKSGRRNRLAQFAASVTATAAATAALATGSLHSTAASATTLENTSAPGIAATLPVTAVSNHAFHMILWNQTGGKPFNPNKPVVPPPPPSSSAMTNGSVPPPEPPIVENPRVVKGDR